MTSRRVSVVFGALDLLTALLVLLGVFAGLPARWAPVDVGAVVLAALELISAVALFIGVPTAALISRIVAAIALTLGLALVTTLALTASWLSGIYGPVGRGGALILVLVAVLACPYLIALPALQLVLVRPSASVGKLAP
jgi:hypothetical protein